MGLNDNVNKISTVLLSERAERKKEQERKNFLKDLQKQFSNELLELLADEFLNDELIFTTEARHGYINNIINNYITTHQNKWYINNRFIPLYKNDVYNYLFYNYYLIANKAERIGKKRTERERQEAKELAKQQKEAEKIARQKAKLKRERIIKLNKAVDIIGIALCKFLAIFGYIALQVLLAIFSFFVGFLKGLFGSAMKTKKW